MDSRVVADEQLWSLACAGDRDAFSKIVERYQTLLCSIAYSMCGALGTSEDMAQEAFITAWCRLKELREPSKLRPWLCGIVRNIAANALRREFRRGGPPESLDVVTEAAGPGDDPAGQAATTEEQALLWKTLSQLPQNYREPLVLFYREEQSITEVARQLELTEDAVKQRLSRGRAMLREEVAALVESTLTRSKPGTAFTAGVLVALPLLTGSTAGAAIMTAAAAGPKTGVAAKGLLAKLGLGLLIGPLIGLLCSFAGVAAATATARSRAERDCIARYAWRGIVPFCFLMSFGLAAVLAQAGRLYSASPLGIVLGVLAWTALLVGGVLLLCRLMERQVRRIRLETARGAQQLTERSVG